MSTVVVFAVCIACGQPAAASKSAAKEAEVKRFEGKWHIESVTIHKTGEMATDEGDINALFKDSWLVFLDSKVKLINHSGFKFITPPWDWDVDTAKTHPTFDWHYTDAKSKREIHIRGIYELNGDDLRLGYTSNDTMPKEFSKDINIIVLKKEKGVLREDLVKEMKKEAVPVRGKRPEKHAGN